MKNKQFTHVSYQEFQSRQDKFAVHLKLTWQFEQIRISLRWTVLHELQEGRRLKLEFRAKRW
jgi:hypothetical protein